MPSLLRSGMHRSDAGLNVRLSTDRTRIEQHVDAAGRIYAAPSGAAMVIHASYPPFEGSIDNGAYLRIALSIGFRAMLLQDIGSARLEGLWRPGTLCISPPFSKGIARVDKVAIIGFAIAVDTAADAPPLNLDHVAALAGRFHDDALLASVMTALYHEADTHGASSAFFDHGRALVLQRLAELREPAPPRPKIHPLSQARYDRLRDYVDSRLCGDIAVADMAAVAGLDSSGLTRALRARTGLPPYAWLTQLRMERASHLLAAGLPVTQAATFLGYANPSKFAAAFRRTMGLSPSEWRTKSGAERHAPIGPDNGRFPGTG